MRPTRILSLAAAAVFSGACATSGQLHDVRLFAERPPKPADCQFEVYEQREPPQEYEVIGTLNITGNEWLGSSGRKSLLKETVCQSGADAVILSRPMERKGAAGRIQEYEAQFVSFSAGALEPAALPDRPEAEAGAIVVPASMDWPEEAVGQSTRKWEPQKGEPSKK
jgi:hypothetical protein